MIKIAHFADVHWRGLTRHTEYKRIFENAFSKLQKVKPDVILIAGDIVHSKTQGISPEIIDCLTWWFRSLGEIATTHVTLGNHDGLILNADREDAISPIIRAIQHPNVHLHKKSGNVKISDDVVLNVFSCFDEQGWSSVTAEKGKINIATFHGGVQGSFTDENWAIEGDTTVEFFDQFDFVMLGDIHKFQYLNEKKTIAYPGSTIQQNYGESQEKGFLFWVIESKDDFDSKFIRLENEQPFVTIDYLGDLEGFLDSARKFPPASRFRIRSFDNLNQGEISQIKGALKSNFKPTEIVIKQEKIIVDTTQSTTKDFSVDTLEDVKNLVFDYYSSSNLSEKVKETISSYLKEAWSSAAIEDTHAGGKFHIKKMEFDNTFGYGEGNVINFDNAEGITGIFGKNASGKSSICGTLAYGLFNGTDRGSLKNLHIVNTRKSYCTAKVYFSKSGIDYLLERQTVKQTNKKGETWAPTNLNLFELDSETGEKKDMSEEQRRETEKILRDLVGTLDDFLLTSLSSQGNVNKFIDLNGAARKSNLAKFLKLDVFDQLNDSLKDELNTTKKILDLVPEKQFDETIKSLEEKILEKTSERDASSQNLESFKAELEEISKSLHVKATEGFTSSEVSDQEKIVSDIEKKIEITKSQMLELQDKKKDLEVVKTALEEKISLIDSKELLKKKTETEELEKSISKSENVLERKKEEIDRDKLQVKNLSDVPCEDKFPSCKYIVNARNAKTTLEKKKEEFEDLKSQITNLQKKYNNLLKESVDNSLKEYHEFCQKLQNTSLEIAKLDLEITKLSSQINTYTNNLSNEKRKLDTMQANICDESAQQEREKLLEKKRAIELKTRSLQEDLSKLSEVIGNSTANLSQTKREKEEFEIRSHKHKSLKLLSKSLSKNGIPLNIVRKKLPQINAELSSILQPIAGFTLELESEEESNDLEIYLNYGDSRRIIECGSGMEKLLSSIALRASLINISNLPRPDIFIVDEGFGALEGKNLESCVQLLREITKYFKSILVISHVDTIKDAVDNIIEIDGKGRDSHVYFD